jgi:hypothetical protein
MLVVGIGLCLPALATPKHLDMKKLLNEPQQKLQRFIPARAGWDGPEQTTKPEGMVQRLDTRQSVWPTLSALLIPDWRVLIALVAAIFCLRWARKTTPEEQPASYKQPSVKLPRAA